MKFWLFVYSNIKDEFSFFFLKSNKIANFTSISS